MLKYIFNIILFSIVVFIILSSIAILSDAGIKKTEHNNYVVWNDLYTGNINADIIILGSSRAWVHISPKILDSILFVNSYNLGIDGHNFKMQKCIYEAYLNNNRNPGIVIHCLDINTLSQQKELYNLEQTIPYLGDTIVSNATKRFVGYNWVDYYNPFSKYLFRNKSLKIGLLEIFNIYDFITNKYKGYRGNTKQWDGKFDSFIKNNPGGIRVGVDIEVRNSFDNFLAKNREWGIETILVYPPELKKAQALIINRDSILKIYKSMAQKYDLYLIDFSDDTICLSKQYFYNSSHLNKTGAEIFTAKLSSRLQGHLQIDNRQVK